MKSWFSGTASAVNTEIIAPFSNAEQIIYKYNQAVEHNSLTQQGWQRLIAQCDDGLASYLTNIKGSTASMSAYSVSLQGSITGYTKITAAMKQYNALGAVSQKEQQNFATAVALTNTKLGSYLTGLNGAKASLSGYGVSLIASTAKTVGLTIATTALNAALTFGISAIITGVVSAFATWINSSKKITEAAEEAKDKISSINDDLKTNTETVENAKQRYAELAQEVENLGKISQSQGSLSTDEYKEFLDLSNQIAGVFPQLTKGYDDNGNAILDLSGSVDTIVGSLDDLLQKEKDLANQKIMDEFPDVYKGYIKDLGDAQAEVKSAKAEFDKVNNAYQQLQNSGGAAQAFDLQGNGTFENADGEQVKVTLAEYEQALKDLGIEYEKTNIMVKNQFGGDTLSGYLINATGDIDTAFTNKLETAKKNLDYAEQQLEGETSSISSYLNTWLQTEFTYNQIDDAGLQTAVQDMIMNFDFSNLPENVDKNNWNEVSKYLRRNILFAINDVQDDPDISKAISEVFTNQDLTPDEKADYLQQIKDYFDKELGKDNAISISLQPQIDDTNALQKNYQKTLDRFKSDTSDTSSKELDSLNKQLDEQTQSLADAKENLQNEYDKISDWGLDDYADQIKNNTIQTKFGNVDMDKRTIIHWSDELKQTYADALASWDYDPEVGSIDTVFGGSERFGEELNGNGWEVAFTPILPDGTFLSKDTVEEYINSILEEAYADDGKVTEDELTAIDAQGRQVGNTFVQGIFAGIDDSQNYDNNGNWAETVGRLMHFSGKFGAKQIADQGIDDANAKLEETKKKIEEVSKGFDDSDKIKDFFDTEGINTDEEIDEFNKVTEGIKRADEAIQKWNEHKKEGDETPISFISSNTETINAFRTSIEDLSKYLDKVQSGKLTNDELLELLEKFPDLEGQTDNLSEAIQNLIDNALNNLLKTLDDDTPTEYITMFQEMANEAKNVASSVTNIPDALNAVKESAQAMKDLKQDIKETGSISYDTIITLMNKYPQMTAVLNDYLQGLASQKDVINALQEVYDTDLKNYKKLCLGKKAYDTDFYKSVLKKLPEWVKKLAESYNIDLSNYKSLAEAKASVDEALIRSSQSAWAKYYSLLQQAQNKTVNSNSNSSSDDLNSAREEHLLESWYNRANAYQEAANTITDALDEISVDISGIKDPTFSSSNSSNSNSNSSTKDTKKTIDWISRKLDVLSKRLGVIKTKASDIYTTFKNQNKQLDLAVKNIERQIEIQKKAYSNYMKMANAVGLSDSLKKKVQNGSMNVSEYSSSLAEKIEEYQKYYDLAQDTKETIISLKEEEKELALQKLTNITDDYDNKKSYLESLISLRESKANDNYTEKDYNYMIKKQNHIKANLEKEKKLLEKEFNTLVKKGVIKKYSDEWYEWKEKIVDVKIGIEDCDNEIQNLAESIIDLRWETFDKALEKLDTLSDRLSSIKSFFDGDLFDGTSITNVGLTHIALGFANMANEQQKLVDYQEEKNRLNEKLNSASLTDEEREKYEERLEEIEKAELDSALALKEARQSIIDIYIDSLEAETEAMRDQVSAQKELLQAEKDLHDYEKSIADKQEDIAVLENKIAELAKSTDRKDIALRLELEEELKETKEDLAEKQYQHDIEQREDALDEELSDFEDAQDEKIKDVKNNLATQEKILNEYLSNVQSSWTSMFNYVLQEGKAFGVDITNVFTEAISQAKSLEDLLNIQSNATYSNEDVDKTQTDSSTDKNSSTGISLVKGVADTSSLLSELNKNSSSTQTSNSNKNTTTTTTNAKVSEVSGNIKYGDSGSKVKILQTALKALGFNIGSSGIDGKFGSDTLSGVKSFQKSTKVKGGSITADGIVGTNTKKKFKANKYKNGVENLKKDEIAVTQENGLEFVLNPNEGILTPLKGGDSVLTSQQTSNLIELSKMLPSSIPQISTGALTTFPSFKETTQNNPIVIENFDASINLSGITRDEINKQILDEYNKIPDKLAKAAYRGGYRKRL